MMLLDIFDNSHDHQVRCPEGAVEPRKQSLDQPAEDSNNASVASRTIPRDPEIPLYSSRPGDITPTYRRAQQQNKQKHNTDLNVTPTYLREEKIAAHHLGRAFVDLANRNHYTDISNIIKTKAHVISIGLCNLKCFVINIIVIISDLLGRSVSTCVRLPRQTCAHLRTASRALHKLDAVLIHRAAR